MEIVKVTRDMQVALKIYGSEKLDGVINDIVIQLSNSSFEVSIV